MRFRGRFIVFLGLLAFVSFGGFIEAFQIRSDNKAFASRGLTTVAKPLDAHAKGEPYQGTLEFVTADGDARFIAPTKVPTPIREGFSHMDSVTIHYLPDQPDKVRFAGWQTEDDPLHQMIETFILFVACVIGLWVLLKNNGRRR